MRMSGVEQLATGLPSVPETVSYGLTHEIVSSNWLATGAQISNPPTEQRSRDRIADDKIVSAANSA